MLREIVRSGGLITAMANVAVAANNQKEAAERFSRHFAYYLCYFWIALVAGFLVWRVVHSCMRYIRLVACLNNEDQRYFARPNDIYSTFKYYSLDAPLFRKRRSRELRLASANCGTLPTRFQTLFLVAYIGTNLVLLFGRIDYRANYQTKTAVLLNRSGTLSVMNMLSLFLFAGRNNPLINLLQVPFDTYNLFHRYIGRVVIAEALMHTFWWTGSKAHMNDWAFVVESMKHSQLIFTGVMGTVALVVILLQSHSILRHAFHEVFLHLHQALAIISLVVLWIHTKNLQSRRVLIGVVAIWVAERAYRLFTIAFRNFGRRVTRVEIETLPGDAAKLTFRMARPWKFRPGQHVYVYVPSIGWWTSHPFSLAWSQDEEWNQDDSMTLDPEKGLPSDSGILEARKTSMSLIVRRRGGFTRRLYRKAESGLNGKSTHWAIVEGPYGGENFHSYGTVMLFAGGAGITHQLPHVRDLVAGYANGTVATRRVILVWIIQSPEHLEWIRPWLKAILNTEIRKEILKILVFVTRAGSAVELRTPSPHVHMFPGRPNVRTFVDCAVEEQFGAMAVSVCGTGSLNDDVREAVRRRERASNVDFVEASFSW